MKLTIIPITLFLLSGCIGATVSNTYTGKSGIDSEYRKKQISKWLEQNNKKELSHETQRLNINRKWCGATLIAVIIPIPLMLPVCESYFDVTFENEIPVSISYHTVQYNTYACSLLMPINYTHCPKCGTWCGSW